MFALPDCASPRSRRFRSTSRGVPCSALSLASLRRLLLLVIAACAMSGSAARADVVITEFLANNNNGLTDENGSREDWIELYNNGTTPENLAGWKLTDDDDEPEKWVLPAVTLEPKGFLIVFASGKDRAVATGVLHTNFKLSSDGGYLALIRPNGTIATAFDPYPAQYDDKPYGLTQTVTTTQLIGPSASMRYFVPTSATPNNATWTARTFPDGTWNVGASGVGFEATVPGWAFKTYFSNSDIGSLSQAEAVISTPGLQTSVQQGNHAVINFDNSQSPGNYGAENPPSWLASGDLDRYVVEGTGIITVPSSGTWSFCVSSDDGCSLQIRPIGTVTYTNVLAFTGLRGMGNTVGTYNFASAGQYEIRAIVFENGGGSGGEVSARAGSTSAWDASFRLIGDTANGGLAIQSLPVGAGGSGYTQFIGANLKPAMFDASPKKSSCYIRHAFNNPGGLTSLSLQVRYDDGIAVYLNGTLVATRNAPGGLTNTSVATADQIPARAKLAETIDLTPHLGLLVAGSGNVIAIHGLNEAANNGDFLVKAELYQHVVSTGSAANYYTAANPGSFNTAPVYNRVAPVIASVQRGFYSAPQNVTLSTGTPGTTIRYTFDGSTPVEVAGSSATYTGPIAIDRTTTLRYRAFKPGSDPSDVVTQTYLFTADVIGQSPTGAKPVITNPPGASQPTTSWPGNPSGSKFEINGQELDFGMDPDVVNNPAFSGTIQNDLKALPTFSIVTDLGNLFDPANGIYVNPSGDGLPWERVASLELINGDGTPGFQANCGLRLRGGFSRSPGNPKHAFRLFFRDSYGPSKLSYPLFGDDPTGADEFDKFDLRCAQNYSWSFQGDGNGHFLQDPFARDQQIAMGHPSSHGGFYHVYVNGHYWGIYNIDERPDANFGESYLGGDASNFDTVKVDPDIGYNIEPTDGNMDAWFTLWQLADTGLSAANSDAANNATYQRLIGRNPDGTPNPAFPVLLDAVNTIDSMLVVYWGGNLDAQISAFLGNESPNNSFFIRDRTGASGGFKSILHDSEHTLLNVNENRLGPWNAGSSAGTGFSKSTPQYIFQQCMRSPDFRALVADRVYKHCYNNGVLTPAAALAMFNARADQIDRAVVAESARWGDSKTNGGAPFTRDHWLNACNNVRNNFIPGRTGVLISQLRSNGWYPTFDPPVFSQRGGTLSPGTNITLSLPPNAPGGTAVYFTTDGSDPRALGGAVAPGAQNLGAGGSIAISASRLIRARAKNGTTWSAIEEAAFYVTQDLSPLAITEIHYNPLPTAANGTDGADYEFLEFKNTGSNVLDLGGLRFDSGLTYQFPAGTTIAPGGFFVLVRNAAKFAARYPSVPIGGVFADGSLNNAGEGLTILTSQGGSVLSFDFDDEPPWPATADGHGFSLVPAGTSLNSNSGSDWRASANAHGSPGANDPPAGFAPIKVNEALTNSVTPLRDAIELFNPSGSDVPVGGWWLSDDRDTPKKYQIPAGTMIGANNYLVFDEDDFNVTPNAPGNFALNAVGDSIYVFAADASGNLTGYSHGWEVDASEPNVSFGRHTNSVGEEFFVRQATRSLGGANGLPLIGPLVISEIMYHPFTGFDEYIEVRNVTGSPVSLDGPSGTTWRLAGINYTFPPGQSIPANGHALVVAIDPATFRANYSVPAAVPIFGPYAGVLQNSGERLALEKPDAPYVNDLGQTVTPYIVIDSVRYNDKNPWPSAADGDGPALQRMTLTAFADDPANWFASGATPGGANSVNQPPAVQLTGPDSGTSFTTGQIVNFTANAADTDGTLLRVEFHVDGLKVGEDSVAPFAFAWTSTGGVHTCTAVAIDNALGVQQSAPIEVLVTTPVTKGLRGEYFANRFLNAPVAFTRTDTQISFTDVSGGWVNFGGVGVDQFSVRWTGQIRPTSSGNYTFYTTSDDGVRLYVNGQALVNDWQDQSPTENSGTITLAGGQLYTIVMEFYENSGGAEARLSWSGPTFSKQTIPQSALYPDSAPIVITSPTALSVEAGAGATLNVLASGIGNTYQWRRNGVNVPGATSASLVINPTIVADAGTYSCIVSNTAGFAISGTANLNVTFTDSDTDGMQNSWEIAAGLNPNSAADGALDKDGDGESNLEEYLAGTNPSNPNDYLKPTIAKSDTGWRITFTAQPRKRYVLQYKTTLADAQWTTLQIFPEQPGTRTIEATDPAVNATRFYRVASPGP